MLVAQPPPALCDSLPGLYAHQAPVSMKFSRQEYWSGLPFLLQGIFLTPVSLHCWQMLYCLSHQRSPPSGNENWLLADEWTSPQISFGRGPLGFRGPPHPSPRSPPAGVLCLGPVWGQQPGLLHDSRQDLSSELVGVAG